MILKTFYTVINVSEDLPDKTGHYYTDEGECKFSKGSPMWLHISTTENIFPHTWLKETKGYVFTENELRDIIGAVWEDDSFYNKEDFIDNFFKK